MNVHAPRLVTCLLLVIGYSLGCSLVIDTGTVPTDANADQGQLIPRDAEPEEDAADSEPEADASAEMDAAVSADQGEQPSDASDVADATDEPARDADGGQDMAAPPPECADDSDCGDARRCAEGACEDLSCESCENGQLCFQGCCELPGAADAQTGLCHSAFRVDLSVQRQFDSANEPRDEQVQSRCGIIRKTDFFEFTPPEDGPYCVRVNRERAALVLAIGTSCCFPDAELECERASAADRNLQMVRRLFAHATYRIAVGSSGDTANAGTISIVPGECPCEDANDCSTGGACAEGFCVNRLGQACDGNTDCGRGAVCDQSSDEPICVIDR